MIEIGLFTVYFCEAMVDFKSKFKRQIEILGICLNKNYKGMMINELADLFKVESLTIKRDMNDLRSAGIDIHSAKGKGVGLERKPPIDKIRELIKQYSALNTSDIFVEKSTALLVNRLKEDALANMVVLQMCIDKNKMAVIDYEKDADVYERKVEISPLLIFQTDNYWRLLTINEGKIKQFLMNKIISVRESNKSFRPVSKEKIEDVFKHSFRSWLGEDTYKVKLEISPYWSDRIKPKQLLDSETFTEQKNGSVIYEATVNSLDEIAGWIATRGEGVKVIEPDELKGKVIKLAEGILKNYK
jgi:predicted DNA-binding transcriptional regulator YafY